MNYRHAFHAGNFADVLKHAVLARLIVLMQRKDTAFRILDTHAGVGLYDLSGPSSERTGEWCGGIARLLSAPIEPHVRDLLAPYLSAVASFNQYDTQQSGTLYPGSPMIARHLMRPIDRLTAVELHPVDCAALASHFEGDHHVKVVELDGRLALKSFLPPRERRGLVLIDPPFEETDEFTALVSGLIAAYRRFATGVYAIWYPIKDEREASTFRFALAETGIRKILAAELRVARIVRGRALAGCGLALVNPPWTLEEDLRIIGPALADRLSVGPGGGFRLEWIVGE